MEKLIKQYRNYIIIQANKYGQDEETTKDLIHKYKNIFKISCR